MLVRFLWIQDVLIEAIKNNIKMENEEIKLSVIIPVYKVEQYLDKCVNSIVNQTYKNLEIILVDDGSPDNCPKMCDKWAERDHRIRVIHQKNGGQSCARNTGLSVMTGDYVAFVDSDDWLEPDTYEYSIKLLQKYKADVVQFGMVKTTDANFVVPKEEEVINVYEDKEILEYYMTSSTQHSEHYAVCRCIFDAPTAKRYKFREGKIHEDIDYKYRVLRDSHKLVDSNLAKYYYWQGGESTTRQKLTKRHFQLYEAVNIVYELSQEESYGKIAYQGKVKKARVPFSMLCRIAYYGIEEKDFDKKEIVKQLTKEHRGNVSTLLGASIPLSRKVLALMLAVSFRMTEVAVHLFSRVAD